MRLTVLRQADWLDKSRIEGYAAVFLAVAVLACLCWVALADGVIDRNGQPIGTDFSNLYAAGTLVHAGVPELAFSAETHYAAQKLVFGRPDVPFYGWHYPPTYLFVAAVFALVPYGAALALHVAATLALYLRTMAPLIAGYGRAGWILALGFPAVFVNIGHGQNGFLTAALLGGGLMTLRSRPVLAGILFGLLTYKPQFGLLLPVVLIATANWRAFFAAAATAIGIAAASALAFGPETWAAFFAETSFTREIVLEAGTTGWHKMQSLFAALRQWGAPVWFAYDAQLVLGIGVATIMVAIWRSDTTFELKAAALAVGSMITTPYLMDYDLAVLALSIAWLAREGLRTGFAPWEKSIMAAVFGLPIASRSIGALTTIPLGIIVMGLLLWAIVRRSEVFAVKSRARQGAIAQEPSP